MIERISSVVLIFILAISACQEDKECTPPTLEKQIIGSWEATFVSETNHSQEIEFLSDGEFREDKAIIFGAYNKPILEWKVKNDTLYLNAKFSDGSSDKYNCYPISRTCEEIIFDFQGIDQLKLVKRN